jgi:hypothetical protein
MHELSAVQKFDSLVEFTGKKTNSQRDLRGNPTAQTAWNFKIWKSNSFRTLRTATGR